MSLAEIKQAIDCSTAEERDAIQRYLIERYPSPGIIFSNTFDDRMREMDNGKSYTWEEVQEGLRRLDALGL